MVEQLPNRVAVVTGAGSGIGAAIARRLAAEGARVLLTDVRAELAAQVAREIETSGGISSPAALDVTERESVFGTAALVHDAFGTGFDLLVCNAGVQTFQRADAVTPQEWEFVLNVNARGTLYCLQMASAQMTSLTGHGAAIVAISSVQARLGAPFYPHYSASKAAVLSLVRSFALTLAPQGIRVNAVAPGIADTELWARADAELSRLRGEAPGASRAARLASIPLNRAATVEEVAGPVLFLLGPDSSYITGECIHISGGDYML